MKHFRTFKISGTTAYAKGERMNYPSNSTIEALRARGVRQIVWGNGSFLTL